MTEQQNSTSSDGTLILMVIAFLGIFVAEVADTRRNSVLNLLDICFGLGLASLPLVVQALQRKGGLELIFWSLSALTIVLLLLIVTSRFPAPTQSHSAGTGEAVSLFGNLQRIYT